MIKKVLSKYYQRLDISQLIFRWSVFFFNVISNFLANKHFLIQQIFKFAVKKHYLKLLNKYNLYDR